MTVKQLIAKLKKMPQDLPVYGADHDHGDYETAHRCYNVYQIDQNEANDSEKDDVCFNEQPERYVVIRP